MLIHHRSGARATALRFSLLASLGLVPVACGGTFQGATGEEGGDSGSGGSSSGTTSKGGTSSKGGSTSKAGNTSGGSTTTAGTGMGGGSGGGPACTNPKLDPATGLVTCDEGYTHRPQAMVCGVNAADAAPAQGGASGIAPMQPRADGTVPCAEDPTICSQYQYGYCDGAFLGGEVAQLPTCQSGCVVDGEFELSRVPLDRAEGGVVAAVEPGQHLPRGDDRNVV